MEQVHSSVVSEVADIHAETSNLATRFNKLDASANHLEKELDERLVRVSSDIISGARTQLENALNVVLRDLGTRNSKELNGQLEDRKSTRLNSSHIPLSLM